MKTHNREYIMENYSQKSNSNDREHQIDNETCYKPFELEMIERDEFTKDKDRIVFTRVFRRLSHKSQIYSFTKGDHYRNRLTHSIEVSQIAKSISFNLGLNKELTEAISLGHDIGHTPFGHAGERVLNEIMCGENNLDGLLKFKINYGGFKHNFQSLKTLDILERKFESIKGLNLTWQVKEGVLKHTGTRKCDTETCVCGKCCDLSRFMQTKNDILKKLYIKSFPCTLEGQVVAIADEIAQRQHDLDDGLRDQKNDSNYYEISIKICEFIDDILDQNEKLDKELIKFAKDLKNKLISRNSNETKSLICQRDALTRDVIEYFILDATYNSFNAIINDKCQSLKEDNGSYYIDDCLVDFSPVGCEMSNKIEKYIENKIHKSESVKLSDENAKFMIKHLFIKYYQNPNKLTPYGKFRLRERLKRNYEQIYNLKFADSSKIYSFDPKKDLEERLIKILQLDIDSADLEIDNKLDIDLNQANKLFISINKKNVEKIDNKQEMFIKCLLENHYAYLSVICDHIAGMTDNYARKQFSEMLLT